MIGPLVLAVPFTMKVQNNVWIDDGVTLEDEVFCGPSVVLIPVTHGFSAAMHAARTRLLDLV